jgi:hypothetical protein
MHLIDEQIHPDLKKIYTHKYLITEKIRQRFFYVIGDLHTLSQDKNFNYTTNFFKYFNRDFRLLLLDILISDIIAGNEPDSFVERMQYLNLIPNLPIFNQSNEENILDSIIGEIILNCNSYRACGNSSLVMDTLNSDLIKCKESYYNRNII